MDVIWRFRCDVRLIREAAQIDFRGTEHGWRDPESVKASWRSMTTACFLSFWTKISPRRRTASRGKCSHLRREISQYPRVTFYVFLDLRGDPESSCRNVWGEKHVTAQIFCGGRILIRTRLSFIKIILHNNYAKIKSAIQKTFLNQYSIFLSPNRENVHKYFPTKCGAIL